jgi:hypothetical protein
MPFRQAAKPIRVFISSTFRDMHAERDYSIRQVFPEMRSRCQKLGSEFIGLDLRCGVTEEEARHEGALNICLDETSVPPVYRLRRDRYYACRVPP